MSRSFLGQQGTSFFSRDTRGSYELAPGPDEPYGIDVLAPAFEPSHGQNDPRYNLSREEVLKGFANRFVHSTTSVSYTHLRAHET